MAKDKHAAIRHLTEAVTTLAELLKENASWPLSKDTLKGLDKVDAELAKARVGLAKAEAFDA